MTATEQDPQVWAIVLAAGRSQRMSAGNKLLQPLAGHPLIAHVVEEALASRVYRVVVVTGHDAEAVAAALAGRPVQLVHNPEYAAGMSSSLQAGLRCLPERAPALVCLGDMPRVTRQHIDRVIEAFLEHGAERVSVPHYAGRRGNPVLWPARCVQDLMTLRGDMGGRDLLAGEAVVRVPMDDDGIHLDVDTDESLRALQGSERGGKGR